MNRRVELSKSAKRQVFRIAEWWGKNRSKREATRWLVAVASAINSLSTDADRCLPATDASGFEIPVQQLNSGVSRRPTHRLVFSVFDDRVLVHAVRHLAQQDLTTDDLS